MAKAREGSPVQSSAVQCSAWQLYLFCGIQLGGGRILVSTVRFFCERQRLELHTSEVRQQKMQFSQKPLEFGVLTSFSVKQ